MTIPVFGVRISQSGNALFLAFLTFVTKLMFEAATPDIVFLSDSVYIDQ